MLEEQKAAMKKHVIRWMEDNRGLILTLFGLPASFIFDMFMQVTTFSDIHHNRQITYYADYVLLMSLFCERPRPPPNKDRYKSKMHSTVFKIDITARNSNPMTAV